MMPADLVDRMLRESFAITDSIIDALREAGILRDQSTDFPPDEKTSSGESEQHSGQ